MNKKNILQVVILVILIGIVDAVDSTITGVSPDLTGETIIDKDTVWENETLTTLNLSVRNMSQRVSFEIRDSTIIIDGNWTLAGESYNVGADIKIINSTITFSSSGILGDHEGAVVNYVWVDGETVMGTFDRSRYILLGFAPSASTVSRLEIRNSTIKGQSATNHAGGIMINSIGNGCCGVIAKPHTVIIVDTTLSYHGGAHNGHLTPALDLSHYDPPPISYGSLLANDSELRNITFFSNGFGVEMPNMGESSKLIDSSFIDGGDNINHGKYFNNLHINSSQPVDEFIGDGVVFSNSYINARGTKLNFYMATNTLVYNNTIHNAAINAGDGGSAPRNLKFYNNTAYNSGIGSRNDGEFYNNTFIRTAPSWDNLVSINGSNQSWHNNNISIAPNSGLIKAFYIVPHDLLIGSGYDRNGRGADNVVKNNTISGARWSFYVDRQDNLIIQNNTVTNPFSDYPTDIHFSINNSLNVKIIDMDLIDPSASSYDVVINNSDDVKFINTKFNKNKIGLSGLKDVFNAYYYLDVQVVDVNGHRIEGATITAINEVNLGSCNSINIKGEERIAFVTGSDGHTSLPADELNSIAILDLSKTSIAEQQMTYTVTAEKDGVRASVSGINPDESWYRADPNIPIKTITIVLPRIFDPVDSGEKSDEIKVYPNPYIEGKSGEKITFDNLPKQSIVRIYALSGELLKELKNESSIDGEGVNWKINEIGSGVYLYVVTSSSGLKKGKVSIVK